MEDKNNGGPAFPHAMSSLEKGMTLRDYFAAKFLPAIYGDAMQEARRGSGLFHDENWRDGLADDAYKMADAMLAARELV